jgi:hypothetical protein
MPIIDNPELYKKAKEIADERYSKPSAYKSGFIVKKYKELGGTYTDDKQPKNLQRWFKEDWTDVGGLDYPVYRPTKRINKKTPLTPNEIDYKNLLQQIFLKQYIKGNKNLPPFEGKGIEKYDIKPYSYQQAKKLGVKIEPSKNPKKKIDVYDMNNQYITSVGAKGYSDYPTYMIEEGKEYAENRRRLYKIRHKKDKDVIGSAGYYADKLLW